MRFLHNEVKGRHVEATCEKQREDGEKAVRKTVGEGKPDRIVIDKSVSSTGPEPRSAESGRGSGYCVHESVDQKSWSLAGKVDFFGSSNP